MNPYLMIFILGIFFILVFGAMALLRREGLSTQFALEALGITAFIAGGSWLLNIPVNPVIFLVIIYLLTMRVRLLVDIANLLSNRGRQRDAMKVLQFALRLYPDHSSRLVTLVNMGIVQLRRKNPESARELFEMVLNGSEQGNLGVKYEAACRYNLGIALQQLGHEAQAAHQFNEVTIVYPNSIYSKAADMALEKRRRGKRDSVAESTDEREDAPGMPAIDETGITNQDEKPDDD
jgi:tetratricopeptide (TPR) repeat protein